MASGRLILAHGFPTIKEVLRHNENALLADPANPGDLKDKFSLALHLVNNGNLAETAKNEAWSLYTWQARANLILEFYRDQR